MSTQDDSPSAFPSSMGPGARPIPGARPNQNNPRDRQSTLQQVMEVRSKYNIERLPNGVSLGYELNGMPRHYNLSFEAIPLGGFQQWVLFGREASLRVSGTFLIDCIRGGENMTGRLMSGSEAEGFALHSSKRMMYGYLSSFIAVAGGYGIAYTGIKNMKFPFMKAKEPEKYQNFPNRFVPVLKGNYARFMWQVTRFNFYAVLGIFCVAPISRSISNTSMMVGLYKDHRTQEYMKSVKGTLDRITSNQDRSKRGLPSNTPQSQTSDQDGGSSEDYGGVTSNTTSDSYGGDSTFTDNTTDTGLMTDSTMQQRTPTQPSPYNRRPQAPTPPSPQAQQSDYFFDDASPTAGNAPYSPSTTTTHRSEGSIWDRIRKDQRQPSPSSSSPSDQNQEQPSSAYSTNTPASPSASPQPGPFRTSGSGDRSSSTSAESFSFSSSDEERVVAKQQAQREFDEMLERDRREGEMGGGGGGGMGDDGRGGGGGSGSGSAWGRRRGG